MQDWLVDLQAYLGEKTTIPALLIQILAFLLVIALAYAFTSALRYAARERKKVLLVVLVGAFALATLAWWSRGLGYFILIALALYLARRPILVLLRALGRLVRRRRDDSEKKRRSTR